MRAKMTNPNYLEHILPVRMIISEQILYPKILKDTREMLQETFKTQVMALNSLKTKIYLYLCVLLRFA